METRLKKKTPKNKKINISKFSQFNIKIIYLLLLYIILYYIFLLYIIIKKNEKPKKNPPKKITKKNKTKKIVIIFNYFRTSSLIFTTSCKVSEKLELLFLQVLEKSDRFLAKFRKKSGINKIGRASCRERV